MNNTHRIKRMVQISDARRERWRRIAMRLTSNPLSVVGLLIVLTVIFCAVFAPLIAPYPGDAGETIRFETASQAPSLDHPMGTDTLGRDIFSRALFGARLSLLMGVVVLSGAISIGVTGGLVAGYLGGLPNKVIMRTTDIFLSVPPILLALAVTAVLGPSLRNAMIAIAFAWWPWYTRLVQGEVLSVKEEEFIEVSESLGAGWVRIIFREILPNVLSPIMVKATLDFGFVILVGAGLAFLGLGAQPPTPDWGAMIAEGRSDVTRYWWIATMPGLAISFTVLGFNLLGDGLRDMFDVDVKQ
ncbi:ABC transporter permease [Natrialbaceae archaeon A-CW2]